MTSLDAPLQSDVTVNRQIPITALPILVWVVVVVVLVQHHFGRLSRENETAALAADAGELLVGAEAMDAGIAAEEKKKAFAAKRSAHYNEFQRVQEMRARMAAGEGDDDDDECED